MATSFQDNPYQILGVDQNTDFNTLKEIYKQAVLLYHPDKQLENTSEKFLKIRKAWQQILKERQQQANDIDNIIYTNNTDFIWETIDLDDMKCAWIKNKQQYQFTFPCKCGDNFTIYEADLDEKVNMVLVPCVCCTLIIKVRYLAVDQN
eukprot:TRINITY_DN6853_c0_g1_i9.p2 TRINITY_DN6853_c0_g1~~TRINITY_DN6853_c0_g1_i9.p2  ORF type:complete len:149 (-),score=13.68 TRINITY_DN6853_c0_g1_i9:208-654(-)